MLEKLELTAKICSRSLWLHCFYICQPVTSQVYSAWGAGSASVAGAPEELGSVAVGCSAPLDMEALCV